LEEASRFLKKTNDPSPHTYNTEQSFAKSQLSKKDFHIISKTKNLKFTDVILKSKKGMPGVG
jgi:hypothetical protein